MTALLSEYFLKSLSQQIEQAILIEPKILISDDLVLALTPDGILSIMDDDAQLSCQIKGIKSISQTNRSDVFHIAFNGGYICGLNSKDDQVKTIKPPADDILQVVPWSSKCYYVTQAGRLWMGNKIQDVKDVVAVNVVFSRLYLLLVDGSVKMMQCDEHGYINSVETSKLKHITDDIVKLIIYEHGLAIDIHGMLVVVTNNGLFKEAHSKAKIIDVCTSHGARLELCKDGTTYMFDGVISKGPDNIIALSMNSGLSSVAMITSDGRVLFGAIFNGGNTLQTILQLQL